MALKRKHVVATFAIYIGLTIGAAFQSPEKRIPGSSLTVDPLVMLFIAFAIMFADKLDQIINAINQGNRSNNDD